MQVTQTLGKVCGDELRKKVDGVRMQVWWVLYSSAQDILINLNWRAAIPEGREPAQHFENQNPERPPVV